jgi:protein-L-isoaspartate(D-aspartate) O-methyltransferase
MPFENVTVVAADAVKAELTEADVIYVNAGVTAPPAAWLQALLPGGRLIFPWRPSESFGMAILITRRPGGFEVKSGGLASFTPCIGASEIETVGPVPDLDAAHRTRSIRLTAEQKPDATATAIYNDVWFSTEEVSA